MSVTRVGYHVIKVGIIRWVDINPSLQVLFDYPYSRKLETEADEVGLLFAANACFNPEEATKIWTHLPNFNVDDRAVEYLSTHPCNERRYVQCMQLCLIGSACSWALGF